MNAQDRFIEGVRNELDRSVEAIDAATRSRLNRARQRALEQGLGHRLQWRPLAAGLAVASVAALAVSLYLARPAVAPESALADLELLTANEQIEFYDQLEFYEWLENDAQTG